MTASALTFQGLGNGWVKGWVVYIVLTMTTRQVITFQPSHTVRGMKKRSLGGLTCRRPCVVMLLMSRTMFRSLHLYLQVCVMLLGLEPQKHTATAEKRLARVNYCGGQVLGAHHRYRSAPARSVLECATFCGADPGCQAVVFDASAAWCHLGNVIANSDCSNMELGTSGMTHYQTVSFVS